MLETPASMRARPGRAGPTWFVIAAPLGATVPGAPLLLAIHFPNELLHVFFFAGPFALALGNWRLRPV